MDVLHGSLLQHLAEVPTKLVLALIERKLGEKGVTLDEAQRSAVKLIFNTLKSEVVCSQALTAVDLV